MQNSPERSDYFWEAGAIVESVKEIAVNTLRLGFKLAIGAVMILPLIPIRTKLDK